MDDNVVDLSILTDMYGDFVPDTWEMDSEPVRCVHIDDSVRREQRVIDPQLYDSWEK